MVCDPKHRCSSGSEALKFEMVARKVREKYKQIEEERFNKSIIVIKTKAIESKLQHKLNKSRIKESQSSSSNVNLKPS